MIVNIIIQARMSSRRFPGKVLAPFLGRPLLAHVVQRLEPVPGIAARVLATSREESDDPLALYAQRLGLAVVRGPLEDVLGRFDLALAEHPCEAFFRVCADSPLLEPFLFTKALEVFARGEADLVTNVYPRTFPPGLSVELLRTSVFRNMAQKATAPEDREHLTRYLYTHPEFCLIRNIECLRPADPGLHLALDEPGDLERLEKWRRTNGDYPCAGFRE